MGCFSVSKLYRRGREQIGSFSVRDSDSEAAKQKALFLLLNEETGLCFFVIQCLVN